MPGIFISYRREDSAGHAGRLYDRLRARFGEGRVFMDVAGIEAGADFVEAIENAVGSCEVLIVVIGREWLTCTDAAGRRRLDNSNDFIRLETATALKRNVRVIPVLVEGAPMPGAQDLPDDLKPLARRQAVELRDSRWDADVEDLGAVIEKTLLVVRGEAQTPSVRVAQPGVSRSPWWMRVGAPALALLAAAGVGIYFWLAAGPAPTVVPELVGKPLEAAVAELSASGLKAGPQTGRRTREAPARQVLSQSPAAATRVEPGSEVALVYAEPPRVVPGVLGKTLDQARAALAAEGFAAAEPKVEETAQFAEGTVVRQEPPAGQEVSEERVQVTLVVAKKPPAPAPTVAVPRVIGLELKREAIPALSERGLKAGNVQYRETETTPPGTVIDQRPAAGEKLEAGSAVDLVAAKAPSRVPVPELLKRSLGEATEMLEKRGLKVGRVTEVAAERPVGSVVRQQPGPGETLARGSPVDLWVVKEPSWIAVRDAKGLLLQEAEQALARQGLKVGSVYFKESKDAEPNTVISQKPPAGKSVKPDTPVDLWVARRPAERGAHSKGLAMVRGTWSFDLDAGVQGNEGADLWWQQATPSTRFLVPRNGARFLVMGMRDIHSVTYQDLTGLNYSGAKVDGSDGASNQIPEGTVVAGITSDGRYTKFRVLKNRYDLSISWFTYEK